ncbi:MAG: ABC transporter permease [Ignavibacteriota bacterium]
MANLLQDLRYAVRNLRNARGFALVAAATLAIGIGANTAIFSIIDTILLRPLPYANPDQLVRLNETESAPGRYPFAGPDFVDWKTQNSTFQDMTLFAWPGDLNLSANGQPEHITALPTAANFFSLLGVKPLLGRTWAEGEDQPGKDSVLILSYALWNSRYAADPQAIGREVELNSEEVHHHRRDAGQFPLPMEIPGLDSARYGHEEPGTPRQPLGQRHRPHEAGRHHTGCARRFETDRRASRTAVSGLQRPDRLTSLRDDFVGGSRDSLFMMLGAVGLVLLIACANVANLLLSRAMARQKEVAIRSALGASRMRLLAQLLTESLLLSLAGGTLGLILAWGIVNLFSSAKSYTLPRFNSVEVNPAVLGFTFALAIVTGLLFGVFPALQMSRPDLHDELKGGAGASVSHGKRRRFTSNVLVVAEIALSLMLLVSAGLLLEDFARMRNLDIGVRRQGVWTAAVRLPQAGYKTDRAQYNFAQSLLEKARRIGGADAVALTDHLPLEGGSNGYIKVRGQTEAMSNQLVETHSTTPDYFQAMGIHILQGRAFNDSDIQTTLAYDEKLNPIWEAGNRPSPDITDGMIYPCVINQSMARFFWPKQDALGQMFAQGGDHGPWHQVIGVVADVPEWGLTEKTIPEAYHPFTGSSRQFLVVHTTQATSAVTAEARKALGQVDSSLPLFNVRTMDDVVAGQAQGQQFMSALVGSFAGLAALLAAIGIYGVLSYLVTQRTREIGIRMSLGASRSRVLGELLREGMTLAAIGLTAGAGGAYWAGKVLASLLHEVKPGDPMVFGATALLLAVVAFIACYLPARRAAKLDPMNALRYE